MNNFSPNMLKTFKTCSLKYFFKYDQKISIPQKSSIFEKGKKVHALANYYLRGDDISKFETALNTAEKQAWETLKNNEYFNKKYVNSEYNLSCKIWDFWIGGRLDALVKDEYNAPVYYILDYKTGSIPENPEYDYQTMVYLLCAAAKLKNELLNTTLNLKFVYIDLKNNQNRVIDFDNERQSKYEKSIIEICGQIENVRFPQEINHSKKCEFCEYRKICI